MLSLCRSPWRTDLADVPIKLWVRYMPDAIERAVRKLYVPEEYFLDTIETASLAQPEFRVPAKTNGDNSKLSK